MKAGPLLCSALAALTALVLMPVAAMAEDPGNDGGTVNVGPAVAVSPTTASVPPQGTLTLTASGGDGLVYDWTFVTNASGGWVGSGPGADKGSYSAGSTAGVTATRMALV